MFSTALTNRKGVTLLNVALSLTNTVLQNVELPALQLSVDGRVLWINARLKAWLPFATSCPQTLPDVCQALRIPTPLARQSDKWVLTEPHCKDRNLNWSWYPGADGGGYLLGHFVTSRSKLEETIHALDNRLMTLRHERDQAEQSNYSKTAFIANMSHDLRTPLSGIVGFADILIEQDLPESSASLIKSMQNAATQLLTLLNEILDYSDLEKTKTLNGQQIYSPGNLCQQIQALVSPVAEKKAVQVLASVDPSVSDEVTGHRLLLHRVLLNLASNAVKFTEQGSVSITVHERGGVLVYEVSDTGQGMSASDISVLFEPFDRLTDAFVSRQSASGLGLYIVRQFIDLMQGEITVNSRPGEGTTFTVTVPYGALPRAADTQSMHQHLGDFSPVVSSNKVLVIEDHMMAQVVAKHLLEEQGYETKIVNTAADGIAAFKQEDFACVLLDMSLPDASGMVCADAILAEQQSRRRSVHTPILAVTAHVDPTEAQALRQKGVAMVIQKPLTRALVSELAYKLRAAQSLEQPVV